MKLDQKGSALALILAILPVFLSGLLLCFSLLGLIRQDLAMKYECRLEGQKGQERVKPLLASLLALNPKALALRAELAQAIQELALAVASENPAAIAKATAHYMKVLEARAELDLRQKQLIKQSDLLLTQSHASTSALLKRKGVMASNLLLKTDLTYVRGKAPRLAVRPDALDTAPVYNLEEDFENRQALAHEWQYRIRVEAPFSHFLNGEFRFQKACAVTLIKENSLWLTKIIKGRFSLKSVW